MDLFIKSGIVNNVTNVRMINLILNGNPRKIFMKGKYDE